MARARSKDVKVQPLQEGVVSIEPEGEDGDLGLAALFAREGESESSSETPLLDQVERPEWWGAYTASPGPDQPPRLTGALGVFGGADGEDRVHQGRDEELEQVLGGREPDPVRIAVLDTGILKSEHDPYLGSALVGSSDFTSPSREYPEDMSPKDMDKHGSRVAGHARWGTDKIKLLDARVQTGQMQSSDDEDFITGICDAIEWAANNGAFVVTSSIDLPWDNARVQEVLNQHPEMVVITTGGNADTELASRKVDGDGDERRRNALLVGGCQVNGQRHPSRGHGPGVDLMVPSSVDASNNANLNVHTPLPFLAPDIADMYECPEEVVYGQPEDAKLKMSLSEENGVSFGLPVVANMIAKLKLIDPQLTAEEAVDIAKRATQNEGGPLRNQSRSNGMIDPQKAYALAWERAQERARDNA